MGTRLEHIWYRATSSFWFIPLAAVLMAVVLSFATTLLDSNVFQGETAILWWVDEAGQESLTNILSTVANSVLAVAGTVFSVIIAVLTLTTQEYGDRLIRNFMRDRSIQAVLGVFVGTFVQSILVMGRIADEIPLPRFSVAAGLVLGIASAIALALLFHHTSRSKQVVK